jgi:hypothetical protein
MHQLPHLYSWVKHQSGIPQIGVEELGRARLTHRTARPGFRTNLTREFKISVSATVLFSNEASV